jgi:hypothetical protein
MRLILIFALNPSGNADKVVAMKANMITELIRQYEATHDPEVLETIADRYCEYRLEEPIEWMEELIDSSHESNAIYDAIDERYLQRPN